MSFVHLHTHSHYSLLDGLARIDQLVAKAKEDGMPALALTDHGNLYGAIEFYKACKKADIKPIIGCELYVAKNMYDRARDASGTNYHHLIVLAQNNEGYQNLIQLVTKAHLEGFYYRPRVDKNLLKQHSNGLIALSGCLSGELSRALLSNNSDKARNVVTEYQDIFGKDNFYLELQRHENLEEQNIVSDKLITFAAEHKLPLVATQDVHYLNSDDADAHDVLLAVQTGNTVEDTDRLSIRNDDFSFLTTERMQEKFNDIPQALAHTVTIADRCELEITLGENQLPQFEVPKGMSDDQYLRELVMQGAKTLYDDMTIEVQERIDYELGVIKDMGYASYFLIVADYVTWAKNNGIIVGPGRGSAASSIVAYALRITNIDPLKFNLIFERFLNPHRIEMPDIDMDFDDAHRDQVLEYVRSKYGKDHVAQVITFGTMAARGSIRDAGRAMGYSYEFCDRLAKMIPFNPQQGENIGYLKKCLNSVDELKKAYNDDPEAKRLLDTAMRLEGVARHCSTHACAVVITPQPVTHYTPLQKGTKENDIITQYEMHASADLGLLKMDFLGLSNLTIINNALKLIKQEHDLDLDIDSIDMDDKKTFKLLQKGQTRGIFQMESGGMTRYLKQLKPTEFEDIIVMGALYRPGPMDLIPDYIDRKHGKKQVEYLSPALKPVLENTYGIMVYQEQLIQSVRVLAGFTLAEADVLRKAVGKKIRALLEEQEIKFKKGAQNIGTPKHVADKFWELVGPFNRYAFNRCHATPYALITYQTAYLKANYPVEFMTALLNSHADDIERLAFFIDDAAAMGIDVLPPDINKSMNMFAIEHKDDGKHIRFGLQAIKNVGHNVVTAIIDERQASGVFKDIEDFVTRVTNKDVNKKSLESLIKAGAMDSIGDRAQLLGNMDELLQHAREAQKASESQQASLFGGDDESLPPMTLKEVSPIPKSTMLFWEKELLGLFVTGHPMKDFEKQIKQHSGIQSIADLIAAKKKSLTKIAGMITMVKKIQTKTGKSMAFVAIEDITSRIELVVFPNIYEQYHQALQENSVIIVSGKLNDKDGSPKYIVEDIRQLMGISGPTSQNTTPE